MKKKLMLCGSIINREIVSRTWAIEVFLTERDVEGFCLNLLLLDYDLIESFSVEAQPATSSILLSISKHESATTVAIREAHALLALCRNSIQAVVSFLLHYYRDGFSPVNHLDIEIDAGGGDANDYSLVIRTDKWAAPISSEEAKRLLDME